MTKREFLASKGFNVGRGRPSREAMDAMSAYRDKNGPFDDDPARVTVVRSSNAPGNDSPKQETKPAIESYDSKSVRAWARANNLPVGERGRIHPDILKAYGQQNPDAEKSIRVETYGGKDLRPTSPRTSPEGSVWRAMSNGRKVSERAVCVNCMCSLGWHRCATPQALTANMQIERVHIV